MTPPVFVFPKHLFELTPLEKRVIELGVCPRCHKRSLATERKASGLEWSFCSDCARAYVLNLDAEES